MGNGLGCECQFSQAETTLKYRLKPVFDYTSGCGIFLWCIRHLFNFGGFMKFFYVLAWLLLLSQPVAAQSGELGEMTDPLPGYQPAKVALILSNLGMQTEMALLGGTRHAVIATTSSGFRFMSVFYNCDKTIAPSCRAMQTMILFTRSQYATASLLSNFNRNRLMGKAYFRSEKAVAVEVYQYSPYGTNRGNIGSNFLAFLDACQSYLDMIKASRSQATMPSFESVFDVSVLSEAEQSAYASYSALKAPSGEDAGVVDERLEFGFPAEFINGED